MDPVTKNTITILHTQICNNMLYLYTWFNLFSLKVINGRLFIIYFEDLLLFGPLKSIQADENF